LDLNGPQHETFANLGKNSVLGAAWKLISEREEREKERGREKEKEKEKEERQRGIQIRFKLDSFLMCF
jgi:hypothetical protein